MEVQQPPLSIMINCLIAKTSQKIIMMVVTHLCDDNENDDDGDDGDDDNGDNDENDDDLPC